MAALCIDVGSTFTKGVLVDLDSGEPLARAGVPTTVGTDVMDGVDAVRAMLSAEAPVEELLVCSSAGGGLRLAVVGYEGQVTGEAGRRVALSAGGRVVHVGTGLLDRSALHALREAEPDLLLLAGGTDGGNADVLLANATTLARARFRAPVVVAGNTAVNAQAAQLLADAGRRVIVTDNVLPRIGRIHPEPARRALREAFLAHVIGGKRLSRGRGFTELVRSATPDAVLAGVETLGAVHGSEILVVDIGGATSDVYSVLEADRHADRPEEDVAGTLWHARTVEADLGMRWNAEGIVAAADRESLPLSPGARAYAALVAADPGRLASSDEDWEQESELARAAALVAVRRHGRAHATGEAPRPLRDVSLVLASGGVVRHGPEPLRRSVLDGLLTDHAGGWPVPERAESGIDTAYLLFAVGLLRDLDEEAARRLAGWLLDQMA